MHAAQHMPPCFEQCTASHPRVVTGLTLTARASATPWSRAANIPPAIPNIILVVAGGRGRLPSVQVGLIIISGKSKAKQTGARDKPRGKRITGRWSGAIRPCPFHSFSPRRLPVAAVPWRLVLHRSRDLLRRRGRCSRSLPRRRARACERDITVWPAQGIRSSVAHA
jgi:hypothetical protein